MVRNFRFDPKADRKKNTLIIKSLYFEPDFIALDDFLPIFVDKLWDFARFNQCESVKFEKVYPVEIKERLEYHLIETLCRGRLNRV
ncbi:MAG: hypothetical protein P9X24_01530 [Candidatus Hatepunaea meridiana]|nr:hypothetical protein [Candidatus Hatepunaea meridiana]